MQKQKLLFWILVLAMFALMFMSCGFNKAFSGEVKEVRGDTACLKNHCFVLSPSAPKTKVGNKAVFMNVKKTDKRINCTIIK